MAVAEPGEGFDQAQARIAAAILRQHEDIGIVPGQRLGNRHEARAAALADVPGEKPEPAPPATHCERGSARPATSAPASGDIRRNSGTDDSEIAPTVSSATEKSPGVRPPVPC